MLSRNEGTCHGAVGQNGNISSGIDNCCNEESECRDITAEDDLPMACGTTAPTTAPTPSHTGKGSKSKASKKIPSGKGGKKNQDLKGDVRDMAASVSSVQFDFVDDGCMSLHTEKSVFDKRQPV